MRPRIGSFSVRKGVAVHGGVELNKDRLQRYPKFWNSSTTYWRQGSHPTIGVSDRRFPQARAISGNRAVDELLQTRRLVARSRHDCEVWTIELPEESRLIEFD